MTSLGYATAPQVSGVSPVSGPAGTQVQITGSGFGATQGTSYVSLGGSTATVVNWSDALITVAVPATAVTGPVYVEVGAVGSNATVYFNVPLPQVTGISPTGGTVGTQVTITGTGFQSSKGSNSSVTFNGVTGTIGSWSDTQIVATVPANAKTGPVAVTVNNIGSNQDALFTMPNPVVTGLVPSSGPVNTVVQINGTGFGAAQGTSIVQFRSINAAVSAWSDTQITASVPATAASGTVQVIVGGVSSPGNVNFTVPPPQVSSVSPTIGVAGTQVTVLGSGFGATQGNSTVALNGSSQTVTSWSDGQIIATIRTSPSTGPITVTVNNVISNSNVLFTVPSPHVTQISPSTGPSGTQVQINGTGFGATQGSSRIAISGLAMPIVSWSDTQIVATVPPGLGTGAYRVQATVLGNTSMDNVFFTTIGAHIDNITPVSGAPGTQVTINGEHFGATRTQGLTNGASSYAFFNGSSATIVSWSDSQVVVTVPNVATSGPVTLSGVCGTSNADVDFTMANPVVSSVSPSTATVGTQVQINGSGFGASQGTVTFYPNSPASIVSWSDAQVVAVVPPTATTGVLTVTSGGVTSNNNINFNVPPPQVTSITPSSGVIGTAVTIAGSGFQNTKGSSTIGLYNGGTVTVSTWSDTQITGTIASGSVTGGVYVIVNGRQSNRDVVFTLPHPVISSDSPTGGPIGTQVQINGSGFGATQDTSTIALNSVSLPVVNWSDTLITATIPSGSASGWIRVTVGGVQAATGFTVADLFINSMFPGGGPAGTQVTLTGNGFGATQGTSTVLYNNVVIPAVSWSDNQIVTNLSSGATLGMFSVKVNTTIAYSPQFQVTSVAVDSVSPTVGPPGTQVQINGTAFGATQGTSYVSFNGRTAGIVSWSDGVILATVPVAASTGAVVVHAGTASNSNVGFTVTGPVITALSPSSGPAGTQVQISGSGFGASQGSSTLVFAGAQATSITSWSDTQIVCTVPSGAYSGAVITTVGGIGSNNNVYFSVPVPAITSISPTSGVVGTQVTVTGSGFLNVRNSSTITFNGTNASVVSWSDSQVVANVQAGSRSGPVRIAVNSSTPSNSDVVFTMPNPIISAVSPTVGIMGTQVQITGSGFGATQGTSTLTFNNVAATPTNWSDTAITTTVPATATTGVIAVNVGGVGSTSTISFSVPSPQVTSISPNTGIPGTQITVTGTNFGSTQGSSHLEYLNFGILPIVSWSDTSIQATITSGGMTGPIWVSGNTASNKDVLFTYINPIITSISPTSGPVGTQVQINGSGFGATQGSSTVRFYNDNGSVVSWSDTQIIATVPADSRSGAVTVSVAGVTSNSNINFTVPPPVVSSISPASGEVGTSVTISGSGFQSVIGSGRVSFSDGGFNTVTATVTSWSDTQIVATVPAGAGTGSVQVQTTSNLMSNQDVFFNMPKPTITGLVPATGPTGTQVQVNGSGFGATQGSGTITFDTKAATVVSWSDNQVVAVVPSTVISGPVQITTGGVGSNATVYFTVPAPTISSISPTVGGAGNTVTINGTGFQSSQGLNNTVDFTSGGTSAITSWSDTQIVAVAPTPQGPGPVSVYANINGVLSNRVLYMFPNLMVNTLTPGTGPVGTQVTIAGTAFGSTQGTSVLTFNGQVASPSSWSDTQIIATVPVTATTGPVLVTQNGVNSNLTTIFQVPPPSISSYTPTGGLAGTSVTINGSGFQANQRDSSVTFNGLAATVTSWSDTQIVVNVPTGATTGPLLVNVNSTTSQTGKLFEVPNPVIASLSPPEAPQNGIVTIAGSGFGSSMASPDGITVGSVSVSGASAIVEIWSDTSITIAVPASAASGPVTVTKYNATSNPVSLTIEGSPTVDSLSPSSGAVNSTIAINGSGFGTVESTNTVQFNGVQAAVSSWSDTQISAVVPPGTATGPVMVTVAGINSGSQNFTVTNSVQVTDSLGHTTSYQVEMKGGKWNLFSASGEGCSSCSVAQGLLHRTVDDVGRVQSSSDALSHTTNYTYDDAGDVLSESRLLDDGTPVTTSYTYNSFGEPLTVTDPLGNVTTNGYDANGNLTSVTSPAPAAGVAASVTSFAYDTKGEMTQITDPLGHITTLAYYPTGLIQSITDAQLNTTTYEYDLRGNRTAVVDALQNRTTFTYDLGNRLTKITYPDGTFVSFAYDSRGRRTSVTDQNGKVTTYGYDDADRLTTVTDAALNVTTYAYDTENDLLSITDAAGHTTSFTYDGFRRVTQTTFPAINSYETYSYDAGGNLLSKTDRKGQTIQYVYDALNRLTSKTYPDATAVDYVYDLAGKIKQVTDPTGTYGFAYDNMGRLIGTTTQYSFLPGVTYSNAYGYDAASNRTSFTAPDGSTVNYAYDTLSRLTSLTDSVTGQFAFGYDALSRRTSLDRPNGVDTSYTYDSLSRLLSVLHQAGTVTLDGDSYTYDNAGNRVSKTNSLNNTTENYTYDPLYQLTQVAQGLTTTESYTYDAVGNRLSSLGMSPYAYNSSNELTSTPSATFTYDANGNTLTKVDSNGTTTYGWDFENRLTSVQLPAGAGTVTFKYDPFGRRIQKSSSSGTTNYLYDGSNSVEEVDESGSVLARYTQDLGIDQPLSVLRSGAASYYEQDALSSVTSLSNSAGVLANTYIYDSFGKLTASTGAVNNPLQYTAREFDPDTGIYFNRARYFDPISGRFLSQDPVGFWGGVNLYAYTRNNPVILKDAFGYQGCNAEQWAQSPNACTGPLDPNAPFQGPDGLWYNVPEWHPEPTPPVPSADDGPSPPQSPERPTPCPCIHDIRYYVVDNEIQSEYDWARVKILARMVGLSVGLDGVEHKLPDKFGHWVPGIDVILWGYDTAELLELQKKAHEELEKRLNCKD